MDISSERLEECERRINLLTGQLIELTRRFEGHCHGLQIEGSHDEWKRLWEERERRQAEAEKDRQTELSEWKAFLEWKKKGGDLSGGPNLEMP